MFMNALRRGAQLFQSKQPLLPPHEHANQKYRIPMLRPAKPGVDALVEDDLTFELSPWNNYAEATYFERLLANIRNRKRAQFDLQAKNAEQKFDNTAGKDSIPADDEDEIDELTEKGTLVRDETPLTTWEKRLVKLAYLCFALGGLLFGLAFGVPGIAVTEAYMIATCVLLILGLSKLLYDLSRLFRLDKHFGKWQRAFWSVFLAATILFAVAMPVAFAQAPMAPALAFFKPIAAILSYSFWGLLGAMFIGYVIYKWQSSKAEKAVKEEHKRAKVAYLPREIEREKLDVLFAEVSRIARTANEQIRQKLKDGSASAKDLSKHSSELGKLFEALVTAEALETYLKKGKDQVEKGRVQPAPGNVRRTFLPCRFLFRGNDGQLVDYNGAPALGNLPPRPAGEPALDGGIGALEVKAPPASSARARPRDADGNLIPVPPPGRPTATAQRATHEEILRARDEERARAGAPTIRPLGDQGRQTIDDEVPTRAAAMPAAKTLSLHSLASGAAVESVDVEVASEPATPTGKGATHSSPLPGDEGSFVAQLLAMPAPAEDDAFPTWDQLGQGPVVLRRSAAPAAQQPATDMSFGGFPAEDAEAAAAPQQPVAVPPRKTAPATPQLPQPAGFGSATTVTAALFDAPIPHVGSTGTASAAGEPPRIWAPEWDEDDANRHHQPTLRSVASGHPVAAPAQPAERPATPNPFESPKAPAQPQPQQAAVPVVELNLDDDPFADDAEGVLPPDAFAPSRPGSGMSNK
jgi:uncharacterized membrane-anchored protein YhcB (DUF1043 family)